MKINFHFNPPSACHQGGLWERAVQSAKHHLRRLLREQTPTILQLSSLFSNIEAVLNSRPLTAMSCDPHDTEVLSPGHFLIGRPLMAPPETFSFLPPDNSRVHYKLNQQLLQDFWRRWRAEYLPSLQERAKWFRSTPNLQVGDLVTIDDANPHPMSWPLGRVIEVHPGPDGVVRRATVQTANGTNLHPSVKLYRIPLEP